MKGWKWLAVDEDVQLIIQVSDYHDDNHDHVVTPQTHTSNST